MNSMVKEARAAALKKAQQNIRREEEILRRLANSAHDAGERNAANNLFAAAGALDQAVIAIEAVK